MPGSPIIGVQAPTSLPLGLTRYQWLVVIAAWLGWGFDAFDALLFNYVAPLCIPSLLHIPEGPSTQGVVSFWTGALTSLLLVGWAVGGIFFGRVTDKLGRARTLLITMLTYAVGTAACGLVPNLGTLAFFRFVASLGIGGEWAAGASLVAEVVPEDRRVHAGALLYTASPCGLFLATLANDLFTRKISATAANPDLAWRLVFLTGLLPAAVAFILRAKVKEPDRWVPDASRPRIAELFAPKLRSRTYSGLALALIALVTWWSCNAFIPVVARFLVGQVLPPPPLAEMSRLKSEFVTRGTFIFNVGALIGTLLTVPIAHRAGRRPLFMGYFLLGALSIWLAFGASFSPGARLWLIGLVGLTVFGVLAAFTFYLPELFPMRLRGTGAGFCYNAGRIFTSIGPFLVGLAAHSGRNPLEVIRWVALVPLVGVLFLVGGLGVETKGQTLTA